MIFTDFQLQSSPSSLCFFTSCIAYSNAEKVYLPWWTMGGGVTRDQYRALFSRRISNWLRSSRHRSSPGRHYAAWLRVATIASRCILEPAPCSNVPSSRDSGSLVFLWHCALLHLRIARHCSPQLPHRSVIFFSQSPYKVQVSIVQLQSFSFVNNISSVHCFAPAA